MALTERTEIGSREIRVDGQILVRTDTVVERDGVEIARTYHRHVVAPGADLSGEDASVQTVANAVHTAEVIAAYKAAHEASEG